MKDEYINGNIKFKKKKADWRYVEELKKDRLIWVIIHDKTGRKMGDVRFDESLEEWVFCPLGQTAFSRNLLDKIDKHMKKLNKDGV